MDEHGWEVGRAQPRGQEVPFFVPGMTVYNPSIPFMNKGELIVAGRVEKRDGHDSQSMFFRELGGIFFPVDGTPIFNLEDPFVSEVQGKIIFGGVAVDHTTRIYQTEIYVGEDIDRLELLCVGPVGMKDIRLVDMGERGVGIFTRPQGEKGGLGKIGHSLIPDLSSLSEKVIQDAPLIFDQFGQERWGGANQAILLADGVTIGIVGHVAEFESDGGKRYSTMVFEYDTETGNSSPMRVIARREDFPVSKPKIDGLKNVVFTSGITFGDGKDVVLWCGLGDAAVGRMKVEWPFSLKAM